MARPPVRSSRRAAENVFDSTMSPGLMRRTGSRTAKVGVPAVGVKRCTSASTMRRRARDGGKGQAGDEAHAAHRIAAAAASGARCVGPRCRPVAPTANRLARSRQTVRAAPRACRRAHRSPPRGFGCDPPCARTRSRPGPARAGHAGWGRRAGHESDRSRRVRACRCHSARRQSRGRRAVAALHRPRLRRPTLRRRSRGGR